MMSYRKGLKIFCLIIFCFQPIILIGQDPLIILTKSQEACLKIRHSSYQLTYLWKPLTKKDTATWHIDYQTTSLDNDTICEIKFICQDKKFNRTLIYNGSELINLSLDSTGIIYNTKREASLIKNIIRNNKMYAPFKNAVNFFKNSIFNDTANKFLWQGIEQMNGTTPCYKIKVLKPDDISTTGETSTLNISYSLWIDTLTLLPMRYDTKIDAIIDKDTMHQYMSYEISKLKTSIRFTSDYYSIESIPSFYKLKEFAAEKPPATLSVNSVAPEFTLKSLKGKTYSLDDFKNKVVLLDFFYKSCYPCMKAIPELQKLHEKYYDDGLVVIGINPYDDPVKDEMESFLKKRGVTYITLYGGKEVAKNYLVSGYPTLFLIAGDGKIEINEEGFNDEGMKRIESEINKLLSK